MFRNISQARTFGKAAAEPSVLPRPSFLNWQKYEDMKKFNIWREKYFFWLVGNSQEFIDQVRLDVATQLAEEEIGLSQDQNLDKEALINSNYERLKTTTSVLGLLRAREKYVAREFESFTEKNKKLIDGAISLLNEKYLKELNKNIPSEGELNKGFVSDFVRSIAFSQSGGRTRLLSHREIEKALLLYLLGCKGQTIVGYSRDGRQPVFQIGDLLNDNEFGLIATKLGNEYKEIDKIADFCKKGLVIGHKKVSIEPKNTEALVRLWQNKEGYRKEVNKANYDEIACFILEAYEKGQKAVAEAYRVNPRILGKSAEEYVNGTLIPAIEKRLKNDPAARIGAEGDIQSILNMEGRKRYNECVNEVNAIIRNIEGQRISERREDYIYRFLKEVNRQIGTNAEMLKVANPILEKFKIEQESHRLFDDIDGEAYFRGFSPEKQNEFKKIAIDAFFNKLISLSLEERQLLNKEQIKELARSIIDGIRDKKLEELWKRGSVFDIIDISFVNSLTGDEATYFRYLSGADMSRTLEHILREACNSFIGNKKVNNNDVVQKQGMIDDFKEYLNKKDNKDSRTFLAAIEIMASKRNAPHVQSLSRKLKMYFGVPEIKSPTRL